MQETELKQSESLTDDITSQPATHYYQKFWNKYKSDASEHMHAEGTHTSSSTSSDDYSRPSPPDHGTLYYKSFWGAYKGHVRGLLRGFIMGGVVGAFLGGCLALLAPAAPFLMLGGIGAGALVATFTGIGAIIGAELMGKIGNTAGNAAAHFAEKEMRLRYPSLPEVSADSPAPGFGHHFEVPPDKDYNKIFHKEVAIPGLLLGTGIGALLAFGTHGAGTHLIGETTTQLITAVGGATAHGAAHGAAAAGSSGIITGSVVGAGSLFGLSFSVNRGLFKSLFNWSDSLLMGRLTGPSKEEMKRDTERYKLQDPEKPYVISGAQRYDEYQRLLNGYYKKSFSAGWSGDRRGFLGGIFAGTLSGLAAGLLAAAALTIVSMTAYIPVAIAVCVALGGRLGMNIFSDAGREPAAFTSAADLYEERIKSLKGGLDITFDEAERLASERRTHHPDMNPPGTERTGWFSLRTGLVGLAAGAIVGVVLSPFAAFGLGHILGIEALHGISLAAAMQAMPLCATTMGITGFTFGMGNKAMDKLHKVADKIFMGTFFPGHSANDHISHDYPSLAPDSQLMPKTLEKSPEKAQAQAADVAATAAEQMPSPPPMPAFIRDILAQKDIQASKPAPAPKDPSFAMRREQEYVPSTAQLIGQ